MYGIEYEDDILLLLRMIKFLHMQSPDAAHIFCQSHPVVDMEELLMVIDEVMWDIFDDVNFFFDEEYEATVVQCSHPIIDRLYERGRASDPKHGSRQSVWSKKLHDTSLRAAARVPRLWNAGYSRYRRWRKRNATMRGCCSGNWTGWTMSFPS